MNTSKENYEAVEVDLLFKEMREEQAAKAKPEAKKFKILPDGEYLGRVYIICDTVANPESQNYGRKKYEIQLTVTEGDYQGKMAYHHRVIMPHYLANMPNKEDLSALAKWRNEAKAYLAQTDQMLKRCGVDVTDTDMNRFALKIAENNRRRPVINFNVRQGVPYFNYLVRNEGSAKAGPPSETESLFKIETLPDGNDLPLN